MAKKQLNKNLSNAKAQKMDEFYTQLSDIEKELKHYKTHFEGKTVFCNCDDPRVSNFFRYFSLNFHKLGLKKLITTCYKNQDADLFSTHDSENAVYLEYNGDQNPEKVEEYIKPLRGDGDFRSEESIDLLKQADIVVTNPPFSLFREFISQLISTGRKFLIIGNHNAITYKEVFNLLKENKVWLGYTHPEKFVVPGHYELRENRSWRDEQGTNWRSLGNACWFTNLDIQKRHEEIILYKKYRKEDYKKFDNYDVINVNSTKDIPIDFDDAMGVPITFMEKYNPSQFEIISANDVRINEVVPFKEHGLIKDKDGTINGIPTYVRIVIKRRTIEK